MPIFLIIVIVIIGILILIFSILSVLGQLKVSKYNKSKKNLILNLELLEPQITLEKLKPINLNYKLPIGEQCYIKENLTKIYVASKKELKENLLLNSELKKIDINTKYFLYQMNGFLNLRSVFYGPKYEGTFYVSNYRIIIDSLNKTKTIYYKDILKVAPSIFQQNGKYMQGIIIFTNDSIYKIITSDVKIGIIVFILWKKQIFNKEKRAI